MLAPDIREEEMIGLARLAGTKIAGLQFIFDGRETHPTGSLGIAVYPKHATTIEEIVVRAASVIYQAKLGDKNRWVVDGAALQ